MAKILIVDDEVTITNSCVAMLKALGYDTCGAKNSKEAFEQLVQYKPDILILDINLREEFDGFDILKKGLELNSKIQAAILTGGDTTMQECLEHGAKTLLKKPINFNKLISTINEFAKSVGS